VILIHEQGRILDVSESSERVLGRRREDLIGHHVLEFVPPDVVEDLKVKIATAFSRPYESKALRGDGQVLPIEVIGRDIPYQGRVVRMTAVRDISARKRDEQRLIESEERFRLLSEATYEGIVVHENGLILDCNRSFARLVDSTVEACLGRNAFDFIEPASHELTRRNMIAGFEGAYLIGAVSASGRRFPAELQGRNLQGASSARRVVAVRDVTERERAEREIRALNEGLERRVAERTRELGAVIEELRSFAYSVSHDLRAPLRAIDGFARMLSDDHAQALDARGREHLARILSGTRRMAQLIDDLLKLSRVGRAEMNVDQVDLSALAREAVEEGLADRQPPGVRVEIEPGMSARGDASLLRVALTNLLENALKFSRRASEPMVRVGCERGGPEPVFFVSDNGAGFDMAYAGTLFKPFARLHASQEFEGTGIGLATVQRIIHRHGGRIWAEGAPGKGACFRFTLGAGHG
jgi:PAS domain S-box-containing protein